MTQGAVARRLGSSSLFKYAIAVAALLASCLIPAWLVRAPIIYPDTLGYYQAGAGGASYLPGFRQLLHRPVDRKLADQRDRSSAVPPGSPAANTKDGVSTARSVYYGTVLFLVTEAFGPSLLMLLQFFALLLTLWLVTKHVIGVRIAARTGVVAVSCALAGAAIFAAVVMPDVFAGIMILSCAAVIFIPKLRPLELTWFLFMIVTAIAVHKSHLAIAVPLILVALAMRYRWRQIQGARLLAAFAAILVGLLSHVAVEQALRYKGMRVVSPPFALARLIGDGTAEAYLRATCPVTPMVSCQFLDKMPMTENQFLWSGDRATGGFKLLDPADKEAVIKEQWPILRGALAFDPLRQIAATSSNVIRQLLLVGVNEYGLAPVIPKSRQTMSEEVRAYLAGHGERQSALEQYSVLILLAYYLGAVGIAALLWKGRRSTPRSQMMTGFILLLIAGVVINAAVCGAISGVFDRYQGRVGWLIGFGALLLLVQRFSVRNPAKFPETGYMDRSHTPRARFDD